MDAGSLCPLLHLRRDILLYGGWIAAVDDQRGTASIPSAFRKVLPKRQLMKTLILILLTASMALAATDRYRVHYSIRGSGKDITVLAESSSEARRVVRDMFPGAVVTGVRRILTNTNK